MHGIIRVVEIGGLDFLFSARERLSVNDNTTAANTY